MDLSALKFQVDTTELADAILKVDQLGDSVQNLAKPVSEVAASSKQLGAAVSTTGKVIEKDLVKPTDGATTSLSKVEKMIEKAGLSLAVLRNQTIETSDGSYQVADSFTKMQANMLSSAKQAGATSDQMKELASLLTQLNTVMGVNPFDKSASGLASLKKEVAELNTLVSLQSQGLALSGEQLKSYSRDIARVTAAFQAEGKSVEELERKLAELKEETLRYNSEKAKLLQQSMQAEEQVKREAAEKLAAEQAGMRMNDEAVRLFLKNEKRKQQELERTQRAVEKQNMLNEKYLAQQNFIAQGFSASASNRAATMQMQGVSPAVIKSYLDNTKAAEASAKATREAASANKFLEEIQNRLNVQLNEGVRLNSQYANDIVKVRTALAQSGMGAEAAAAKFKVLESQIKKVASRERQQELDRLARGVSVQMGDVGISLAGGMNPLLVMIQQGDQIRGLLQQTNADAIELKQTMNSAAKQIASSMALTAKAIGSFFLGSIVAAGEGIGKLVEQIPVIGFFPKAFREMGIEAETAGKNGSKGMMLLSGALKVVGTAAAFVGGVIAMIPFAALIAGAIAIVNVIRESDNLTRTLVLSGGALNLTKDNADQMVLSMKALGVSTTATIQTMTAMAATGNLTSDSVEMVTVAAEGLRRYGGVAIEDTVKIFSNLAKDPLDALYKVARQTGAVTEENLRLVESLVTQGRQQEAATEAMRIYAEVTAQQIEDLQVNYTKFGNFMITLGSYIKGFYNTIKDAIRGLFIEQSDAEKIADLGEKLARTQIALNENRYGWNRNALEKHKQDLTDQLAALTANLNIERERAEQNKRNIELEEKASQLRIKNLTSQQKLVRDVTRLSQDIQNSTSEEQANVFRQEQLRLINSYREELEKAAEAEERRLKRKNKLTDAQKEFNRQQSAAESIMRRISSLTNGSVAAVEDLNKAEKLRLDLYSDPNFLELPARFKLEIAEMLNRASVAADLAEEEKKRLKELADANREKAREEKKAQEQSERSIRDMLQFLEETELQIVELSGAYDLERENMLKNSEARKKANEIYKIEIDYQKELLRLRQEFDKTDGGIDAVLALQAAIDAANAKKQMKIQLLDKNETIKVFNEIADIIENGISTSVDRALRGDFTGAAKALRDTVQQALAKPFRVIINGVVEVLGGAAKEFIGGQLKSIFGDSIGKIFSVDKFKQYGATFAKAAMPYLAVAAGVVSGHKLGTAISNGYSTGGSGNSMVNTTTAAGTVLGQIIGGPLGAAFGAALGGIVGGTINRLFGRKLVDQGIEGTFGSGGFSGNSFTFEKGGLFRSDRRTQGQIDPQIAGALNKSFLTIRNTLSDYGQVLGLSANALDSFTKNLTLSTKGLSEEEIGKKIEEFFVATSDEMADILLGITKVVSSGLVDFEERSSVVRDEEVAARLIREGESSTQALVRLAEALKFTNGSLRMLGQTLKEVSIVGAESAQKFVDMFGGIEQASQAISQYYEEFYTQEEKLAYSTAILTEAFAELGLSMLPTGDTAEEAKAAYRKLVDDAFAAGNEQLGASLIKLSSSYVELLQLEESVGNTLNNVNNTLRGLLRTQVELEAELLTLSGKAEEANAMLRSLAIEGMSELEIQAYDYNESLKQQIDTLREAQSLQERLNELSLNTSQLRELELAALQPANRELLKMIHALEDAAVVAKEAEGLQNRINELTMSTSELRELELAALQPANRELQMMIYNLEDAANKAKEFKDSLAAIVQTLTENLTSAQSSTDAAVDNLEKIYNEEQKRIDAARSALEEEKKLREDGLNSNRDMQKGLTDVIAKLRELGQFLNSTILEIYGEVQSTAEMLASSAREYLRQVASGSAAVEEDKIKQAVSTARNAIRSDQFATKADFDRERLRLASLLRDVSTNGVGSEIESNSQQLSELMSAEQEIVKGIDELNKRIEETVDLDRSALDALRVQIDELRGINRAVTSIPAALEEIANAIRLEAEASRSLINASLISAANGAISSNQLNQALSQSGVRLKIGENDVNGNSVYRSSAGAIAVNGNIVTNTGESFSTSTARDYILSAVQSGNLMDIYNRAAMYGISLADVDRLAGFAQGTAEEWARSMGLPTFANGGMYEGGLAVVGEKGPELIDFDRPGYVYNARQTASILSSEDTNELLVRMNSNLESLRFEVRANVQHSSKTSKLLDRVIRDGESIQVTTVN